ncbi:unnamed protein product [Microthlaspi erraticum]|uniref:Uncharacterized protein n=1 Tax=Microthlaspi erraticum TaxID=1685480 RepID=A0A6D2JV61_9BRAS|nr:unnamed protein product [Microthlaspi erraticum]
MESEAQRTVSSPPSTPSVLDDNKISSAMVYVFHSMLYASTTHAFHQRSPSASSFTERPRPSTSCKRRSPMWKDSSAEAHLNIIPALVNALSLGVCCVDPSSVMKKQQSIIVGLSTDYVDLDSRVLPTFRCIPESTSAALEYCHLTVVSPNL